MLSTVTSREHSI